MNELLKNYQVAVEHPNASGFEHLEMLMIRDKLAGWTVRLSRDEQEILAEVDRLLIAQAAAFHAELARVTDLEHERQRRAVQPTSWWWYLDVVAHLPELGLSLAASPRAQAA
jgi:hypothetical protein